MASFHQLGEVPKLLPSCDLLPGSKGLQCGRSQSSKDGAKLNGSNSRADGWFTQLPSCQGAFFARENSFLDDKEIREQNMELRSRFRYSPALQV